MVNAGDILGVMAPLFIVLFPVLLWSREMGRLDKDNIKVGKEMRRLREKFREKIHKDKKRYNKIKNWEKEIYEKD